jgi:transposase-like protein
VSAAALPAGAAPAKDSKGEDGKPKHFPIRKRTGTAATHLKSHMVDIGAEELEKLTPREAVHFVAEATWGSTTYMPCPHCGTLDEHYWRNSDLRWKCTGCGKCFSVTSGTVLADHKLPLTKILKMALNWANGPSTAQRLEGRVHDGVHAGPQAAGRPAARLQRRAARRRAGDGWRRPAWASVQGEAQQASGGSERW